MFLESLLDIRPDARAHSRTLSPVLPPMFGRVCLQHVRIGEGRFDITVDRDGPDVKAMIAEHNPVSASA
jgi:hypothetical protein